MSIDLNDLHEMDTFYIVIEGVSIEAAIAPVEDLWIHPSELKDADIIECSSMFGTIRSWRYEISEILIARCDNEQYIEIIYCTGTDEEECDVWKLDTDCITTLSLMAQREAIVPQIFGETKLKPTHNWQKEGF